MTDQGGTDPTGGPDLRGGGLDDLTEIGRSPFAIIYRARGIATGRSVVVKVLSTRDLAASASERFARDQAAMAALSAHPNLVAVLAHGLTPDGRPYVVSEDVAGTTVAERVNSASPLTGPDVIHLGIRLAGALESAHRAGVVHGDLRPEGIVLSDAGEPLVGDFGLATAAGTVLGRTDDPRRVAHLAPEQVAGGQPAPASDVYGLGSVLYGVLAGEPAFVRYTDTSANAVIERIANEPAPDLVGKGVPGPVAAAVRRALSKNAAERMASGEEFGRVLQQAQVSLGLPMTELTITGAAAPPPTPPPPATEALPPPPPRPPPAPPPKKSKAALVVGLLALVAVAVAAFFFLSDDDDDEPEAGATTTEETVPEETTITTTEVSTTTEPVTSTTAAEEDFVNVSDDTGVLTVDVPAEWDEVDGSLLPVESGGQLPNIQAAADLAAFRTTYAASGVDYTAVDPAVVAIDPNDPDAILDTLVADPQSRTSAPNAVCVSQGRGDYSDPAFTGRQERFNDCGGAGAGDVVYIVAAPADRTYAVIVEIHLIGPEDEEALEQIMGSFLVSNFP